MKRYRVEKYNRDTLECVADYGIMCESDMLLAVRGYKPEELPDMIVYQRRGSRWVYMVEEVKAPETVEYFAAYTLHIVPIDTEAHPSIDIVHENEGIAHAAAKDYAGYSDIAYVDVIKRGGELVARYTETGFEVVNIL